MEFLMARKTCLLIGTDLERRLGLTFVYQDGSVFCEITFGEDHRGCAGRISKELLPFVMEAAIRHLVFTERGEVMASQEMRINFLSAMTCDRTYVVKSRLLEDREGSARAIAWIEDPSHEVPAMMRVIYAEAGDVDV